MKGEFYKMDYEAWDEGTIDLTLDQEAAYLRLCHQMYRRHGSVPNSPKLLCVIWRCGHTRAQALLTALIAAGKIEIDGEGALTNQRVSKELADREQTLTKRRAAGEQGGSKSAAIRRNALKNNDPPEAHASTPSNQRREEKSRGDTDLRSDARAGEGPPAEPRQHLTSGDLIDRLIEAAEGNVVHQSMGIEIVRPILDLQAMGCDLEQDILPVIRERVATMNEPLKTWGARWIRDAVLERQAKRMRGRGAKRPEEPKEAEWERKLMYWHCNKIWPGSWGNTPDEERCDIPKKFVEEWLAKQPKAGDQPNGDAA